MMNRRRKLRFGDVIRFNFCGAPIVAMVIGTAANYFVTDEGTSGDGDNVIVFGLVGHANASVYHEVGKTASFRPKGSTPYEVLP